MRLNDTENITTIQRLVALLHLGLLQPPEFDFSPFSGMSERDWDILFHIAVQHDVTAILFDAIQLLPNEIRPSRRSLIPFISETSKFEQQYDRNIHAMSELLSFFNKADIPVAILKGFTLARLYPTPSHRKFNDLDIYLFGKQQEADALITRSFNIPVEQGFSHHTKFCFLGVTVENHYDFINRHSQKSGDRYEQLLKQISSSNSKMAFFDESPAAEKPQYTLLSDTWSALFQLRHAAKHFATSKLNWRIVCDWMFFSQVATVDWTYVNEVCKDFGMDRFKVVFDNMADCIRKNRIPTDDKILMKVLDDTCCKGSILDKRRKVKGALWKRTRRFWDNRWKHRLAFSESWWSRIQRLQIKDK